jgi:hypothetical protein
VRFVAGFFRFWWDFLVGDSAALAIGGVAVLVLAYAMVEADMNLVAQFVVPIAVVATIVASLPMRR